MSARARGAFELDAYLRRIEWQGERRVSFDVLSSLLQAHLRHVPFENLDVLLGRPVRIDLEGVQSKIVHARRGGYCFEQATLFAAALESIGFAPVRHSARVVLQTACSESPRTHMFLTVQLDEGRFVVDPGFGGLAPPAPVALPNATARASHDSAATHAMAREGDVWMLKAQGDGKVVDCWVSTLEEDYPIDFEMGNHYTSTHPQSGFVNRLMLRALIPGGRVTVMNRDVTITRDGQPPQTKQLADRAALRALLAEHFGFDLPEVERMRVPSIEEWR